MNDIGRPPSGGALRPPYRLKPLAATLGVGLGVGMSPAASAATFTISNLNDGGAGSLRQAVADANSAPGADVVSFQPGLVGTITLTSPITVTDPVTIVGPSASAVTIHPSVGSRAIQSNAGVSLTISGLTFQGNAIVPGVGGAIGGGGPLTVQDSVFAGNNVDGQGGAITATSDLIVRNCVFVNNSAVLGGGAIAHYTGQATIQSSSFTANSATGGFAGKGGAIRSFSRLAIDASTLSGNQATGNGGAIAMYLAQSLAVTNSTISGNQAMSGGALYQTGSLSTVIADSTISGNTATAIGGALFTSAAPLTLSNSTVTGNTSTSGGSIRGNTSAFPGLDVASSIVANTMSGPSTADIQWSGVVHADHSLIENPQGLIFTTDVSNIKNQDPMLGPLADNGGPTKTHALLAGSPAIDKGANPLSLVNDQRGTGFSRVVGPQADIGAFEFAPAPPPPAPISPIPTLTQRGVWLLNALLGMCAAIGTVIIRRPRR